MKPLFLSYLILLSSTVFSQTRKISPDYNLDFEKISDTMPDDWQLFGDGDYTVYAENTIVKQGKHAGCIEFSGSTTGYKALYFVLPDNFQGERITLSGYIKTENVTDGWAGLWLRLDPNIGFDNMQDRGITGTTHWKQYAVSLDMNPLQTKQIVVGALLVGKGKIWVDDLSVTVDGKDIHQLEPLEKKNYPAELDKAFDKGSGIHSIALNDANITTLKQLALIWGFLKYYHPAVAAGKYNWDYELFRIVPELINIKDPIQRDSIFLKWINKLGAVQPQPSRPDTSGVVKIAPDLDWITRSGFSQPLSEALLAVKNAARSNESYYIGLEPYVGNPSFKNEAAYAGMSYPDAGFRLLSLYRYWNIIQYYFPYKNLIEEDWKNVLQEFIPDFINASDDLEYTTAVLKLIGRVHDTHANIWSDSKTTRTLKGSLYAPLDIRFVDRKAVVAGYLNDSLGRMTGLKPGDIITKIEKEPLDDIIKKRLPVTPASNYTTQLRDIATGLLRTNDSIVHVTYQRDGRSFEQTLITYLPTLLSLYDRFQKKDTCFKLISPDIAYLYPGSIKNDYLPELWKAIQPTKGLIIDLRCYPSEFIVMSLSQYLLPEPTPFVKFSNASILYPGRFEITDKELRVGDTNRDYYKGKVIILINENTQSQAEYTAMALRVAPHATIIGSTTAGADGNVSHFYLPGGISTMISGIGVYYPDGKETQRIGIVPDIVCTPTATGIREGKDELLDKAVTLISKP